MLIVSILIKRRKNKPDVVQNSDSLCYWTNWSRKATYFNVSDVSDVLQKKQSQSEGFQPSDIWCCSLVQSVKKAFKKRESKTLTLAQGFRLCTYLKHLRLQSSEVWCRQHRFLQTPGGLTSESSLLVSSD